MKPANMAHSQAMVHRKASVFSSNQGAQPLDAFLKSESPVKNGKWCVCSMMTPSHESTQVQLMLSEAHMVSGRLQAVTMVWWEMASVQTWHARANKMASQNW